MNFEDWINSLDEDTREHLCTYDTWRAGAESMIDTLIERGFISVEYAARARAATLDVLQATEDQPTRQSS